MMDGIIDLARRVASHLRSDENSDLTDEQVLATYEGTQDMEDAISSVAITFLTDRFPGAFSGLFGAAEKWPSIETAPKHTEVLVFRADAGVMLAKFTYMAGWLVDEDADLKSLGLTEEQIWEEAWWAYDADGAVRMADSGGDPTQWRPVPHPTDTGE